MGPHCHPDHFLRPYLPHRHGSWCTFPPPLSPPAPVASPRTKSPLLDCPLSLARPAASHRRHTRNSRLLPRPRARRTSIRTKYPCGLRFFPHAHAPAPSPMWHLPETASGERHTRADSTVYCCGTWDFGQDDAGG